MEFRRVLFRSRSWNSLSAAATRPLGQSEDNRAWASTIETICASGSARGAEARAGMTEPGAWRAPGSTRPFEASTINADAGGAPGVPALFDIFQIGRASCRERVCQYV